MAESLLICVAGGTVGMSAFVRGDPLARRTTGTIFPAPKQFTWMQACCLRRSASSFYGLARRFAACYFLDRRRASSRRCRSRPARSAAACQGATLRKTLLTAEIALTVILLVSAGLLFKSFLHLRTSNWAAPPDHVLTMKYGLTREAIRHPGESHCLSRGSSGPRAPSAWSQRRRPGLHAARRGLVTAMTSSPFPSVLRAAFNLQDDALVRTIDPGYFTAMQIPLTSRPLLYRSGAPHPRPLHDHQQADSRTSSFPGTIQLASTSPSVEGRRRMRLSGSSVTLLGCHPAVKATMYFPILVRHSRSRPARRPS